MWLLNVSDLQLYKFIKYPVPSYAILSHTWLDEAEEVSFRDMREDFETAKRKRGFSKIKLCCAQAKADGCEYTWVDSCCIDKSNSAELSEAINSMYKWYQNAKVCYAYLADVPGGGFVPDIDDQTDMFSKSRWFRRGWTLQELIAPAKVIFFSHGWSLIGTKESIDIRRPNEPTRVLVSKLARITGIETRVLYDPVEIETTFVAQRMSWASRRNTTRKEDLAYCLMGLFNINMPILYGEGLHKAFKRLQLELIRSSTDQTIFAWRRPRGTSGLLADKPLDFVDSGDIYAMIGQGSLPLPFSMTNCGLSINLPLQPMQGHGNENNVIAFLQCCRRTNIPGTYETVCIYMERLHIQDDSKAIYRRIKCNEFRFEPFTESHSGKGSDVYVYDNDPVLRHWLRPNTVIGQAEDHWLASVRRFARHIRNTIGVEEQAIMRDVKVALIDDGVNPDKFLINQVDDGISLDSEDQDDSFYRSVTGHGTKMANLICSVCPLARLYVAKLDFSSGSQTSKAKSTAQAIKWAMRQGVDVICMSWTIARTQSIKNDIDAVYREIMRAARWNTIIYCSEPEEGFDFYPPGFKEIKWVGGTVPACERRMEDRFVDYILPGKEASPNCDASSAATALAAGLAAMIILCFEATQDGLKIRNPKVMDKLFISLMTEAKFSDVTGMFDKALSQADPVKAVVDECKRRIVLM